MNEDGRLFNIFSRMILGVLVCIAVGAYGYYSTDTNWMITSSVFAVVVVGGGIGQYITFIREMNGSIKYETAMMAEYTYQIARVHSELVREWKQKSRNYLAERVISSLIFGIGFGFGVFYHCKYYCLQSTYLTRTA